MSNTQCVSHIIIETVIINVYSQIDSSQYGVEKFLLDCLDGPAPILNYLCRVYNIQNVVIGNQSLNLHYEKLPDGVQLIFTREPHIQVF